ncbi:MAG: extracellular solute-binding protein [Spirulina sp.]
MNRRIFLASTLGLTLSSLAAGCQRPWSGDLGIAALAESVPGQLVQAFQRQAQQAQAGQVSVVAKDSLIDLYRLLQTWHQQAEKSSEEGASDSQNTASRTAQWVTQADTWLAPAIQQRLLQPIPTDALDRWPQLPEPWPALVRRNAQGQADSGGDVWGIPYRWTPLAILYDQRSLGATADPIQGWDDLRRPEWNQRLMLPDDERLVIGLALKALGTSANASDLAAVSGLEDFLAQLHRQVRWYNATHTLKALVIGDAAATVGWLDALLPIAQRYRHLRLVIPDEGTLASADLWVRPSVAPDPSPLAMDWLNFCLSETFTEQMAIYGPGLTPWHWGAAAADLPPTFQPAAGLLERTTGLANSEFLLPLDPSAQAQFTDLWRRLRTGAMG